MKKKTFTFFENLLFLQIKNSVIEKISEKPSHIKTNKNFDSK